MIDDKHWMQIALEEARMAASDGEVPVGAVLVKNGQSIVRAHNMREMFHDPIDHAEMICISEASKRLGTWRLRDCTLYVTLEPCPMCAGAMVMSQLGRCVYGAADERQGCCGSVYDLPGDPALQGVTTWQSGVESEACAKLLSDFFARKRP